MYRIRAARALIAGGWLAVHVTVLIAVPTALCTTLPSGRAASACACPHPEASAAQVCPMHRSPADRSCSCRSTADPATAIVASLLGPTAVLARVDALATPLSTSDAIRSAASTPSDALVVPDSPPPRA